MPMSIAACVRYRAGKEKSGSRIPNLVTRTLLCSYVGGNALQRQTCLEGRRAGETWAKGESTQMPRLQGAGDVVQDRTAGRSLPCFVASWGLGIGGFPRRLRGGVCLGVEV